MPPETDAFLAFFRAAEALKDTLRSARTSAGRQESTAEHTWRLCLMALALEDDLEGIDPGRLLRMLIVHDLGEAVGGDIPAPRQGADKSADERRDLQALLDPLPEPAAARLLALWDEYDGAATPEARLAKGLDRLETVLQHVQGANEPDFDYGFNLTYGQEHTGWHPILAALREPVDEETRRLAGAAGTRRAGVRRIVPDFEVGDTSAAEGFYGGILGLDVLMDHGWIVTWGVRSQMPVQISFATQGGSGAPVPDISVEVDDVDVAYERACQAGCKIEYGPADEPWGVRRFFVRDPFGKLVNILAHV